MLYWHSENGLHIKLWDDTWICVVGLELIIQGEKERRRWQSIEHEY